MKFSFHLPVDHVGQPDEFLTAEAIAEMAQALDKAGINMAASMAMMAITTSNSMSVKALREA